MDEALEDVMPVETANVLEQAYFRFVEPADQRARIGVIRDKTAEIPRDRWELRFGKVRRFD